MTREQVKTLMPVLILIIVAVFLFYFGNEIITGLGLKKSREEKNEEKKQDREQKKAETDKRKELEKKLTPTWPKADYFSSADVIYQLTGRYSDIDSNYSKAVSEITRVVKNALDWEELKSAYGKRQNYNFGVPTGSPHSLVEHIKLNFPEKRTFSIKQHLWRNKTDLV